MQRKCHSVNIHAFIELEEQFALYCVFHHDAVLCIGESSIAAKITICRLILAERNKLAQAKGSMWFNMLGQNFLELCPDRGIFSGTVFQRTGKFYEPCFGLHLPL